MNRYFSTVLVSLMSLVIAVSTTGFARSSKHAKIRKGVGNVVIGKSLPYKKDKKWKGFVKSGGSISADSLFNKNDELWVRAFFKKKIKKIKQLKKKKSQLYFFYVFELSEGSLFEYGPENKPGILCQSFSGGDLKQVPKRDSAADVISMGKGYPKSYIQKGLNHKKAKSFSLNDGYAYENNFNPWIRQSDRDELLKAAQGKFTLRIFVVAFPYKGTKKTHDSFVSRASYTDRYGREHSFNRQHSAGQRPVYKKGKVLAKGVFNVK